MWRHSNGPSRIGDGARAIIGNRVTASVNSIRARRRAMWRSRNQHITLVMVEAAQQSLAPTHSVCPDTLPVGQRSGWENEEDSDVTAA